MTHRRSAAAAALALGALLLCAACTAGGSAAPRASSTPPSSTPTTSTSARKPPPAPPAPKNPFTGIGAVPTTPTIAVKIDDTAPGRPQVGIDKADIVYIEAVEGGLTRLAAVFGTNKPGRVGYVRSTRPSDPDLLLQYGKITEAFSGGAHDSLPRVKRAGLTAWSMDAGRSFYARHAHAGDHGYINVVLDLAKVAKAVHTPRPRNIGWTFDSSLSGLHAQSGNRVRTEVTGSYQHGTQVEFRYWKHLHKYVRYIDGAPQRAADGKPVAATNVIVQSCRVKSHPRDTDVNGNPSQFTYTVGSGKVTIFRQGKRVSGAWTRKHLSDGTTFRAGRKQIPLAPGNTWVVLIRNGVPVTS